MLGRQTLVTSCTYTDNIKHLTPDKGAMFIMQLLRPFMLIIVLLALVVSNYLPASAHTTTTHPAQPYQADAADCLDTETLLEHWAWGTPESRLEQLARLQPNPSAIVWNNQTVVDATDYAAKLDASFGGFDFVNFTTLEELITETEDVMYIFEFRGVNGDAADTDPDALTIKHVDVTVNCNDDTVENLMVDVHDAVDACVNVPIYLGMDTETRETFLTSSAGEPVVQFANDTDCGEDCNNMFPSIDSLRYAGEFGALRTCLDASRGEQPSNRQPPRVVLEAQTPSEVAAQIAPYNYMWAIYLSGFVGIGYDLDNSRLSLTYEHTQPGVQSELIIEIGSSADDYISCRVTGPGVIGNGVHTRFSGGEIRVPINRFGTYMVRCIGGSDASDISTEGGTSITVQQGPAPAQQ